MRSLVLVGALVACVALSSTASAQRPLSRILGLTPGTVGDVWAQEAAANQPWHGQYYYMPYGQPTALVVPPTAAMQQNYSWGVSQNTMTPIYHQYGPTAVPSAGGAFYATPRWPSHTNQFGVYPVRVPW